MAIKQTQKGFALLIAVIFMSVTLSLGLVLGSLAYKQGILASNAIESQYAFYAADAALECALHADQKQGLFAYNPDLAAPAPAMTCDNAAPVSATVLSHTADQWVVNTRLSFDSNKHCADVTTYVPSGSGTVYLFSRGYNVPCSTVASPNGSRFVSRGLEVSYSASGVGTPTSTGQIVYATPGPYSWTVPAGVTSVSVVCVGGGGGGGNPGTGGGGGGGGGGLSYVNNITVSPGQVVTGTIGSGGAWSANGGTSSFSNLCSASGGIGGATDNSADGWGGSGGSGGSALIGVGGIGGSGGNGGGAGTAGGGGGSAAGYSGTGGRGGGSFANGGNGSGGSGGGGGGGNGATTGSGGGVGLLGVGANGTGGSAGIGGAGGSNGGNGGTSSQGGLYGGGGGAGVSGSGSAGGGGACRIIWPGDVRQFPSTRTADE